MLVGRQGGEDGVLVGEEEAGGKERDEGGQERRGEERGYRKPQVCAGWRVGGLKRGQ